MFIIVETKTNKTKHKILNFQIAGNEICVNYKIGSIKTEKRTGSIISTTIKAVVQSDIVKLSAATSVTVVKDSEIIYSYEKNKES